MTADLDVGAICAWVDGALPGLEASGAAAVGVSKFAGGQSNPTYRLDTPAGAYVLRRKPSGVLLKSAHAVDREFRVQRALAGTAVPVAPVHLLCDDEAVIGAMFYIMDHVPGENYDDPTLPGLEPAQRGAIIADMGRVLAALHDVDLAAVGLTDYGPEGNYFERQLSRWSRQYRASETETVADMDGLIETLAARLPADDGQRRLVHGDYRLDNLIFGPEGLRAVLDWELSTLGHPYADLGAVLMQWQMPQGKTGRGLMGADRAALGLPDDAAFVRAYCRNRGIAGIEDLGFYVSFAYFRMAAILQGVKKRALDGNASNPEHGLRLGAYVPLFAAGGMQALTGKGAWDG